jgi:hypothetical protein
MNVMIEEIVGLMNQANCNIRLDNSLFKTGYRVIKYSNTIRVVIP